MEQNVIKEFSWKALWKDLSINVFVVGIAMLYLLFASYKMFTADFTWFRVFGMGMESIILGINASIIYKDWNTFYRYIYKIKYKDISHNGRAFKKEHFEKARLPMLGHLGHPETPNTLLNEVTHQITEVKPKDEHLFLELKFIRVNPIPPEILRECKLSPRGVGNADLSNYQLFSFDFIPK